MAFFRPEYYPRDPNAPNNPRAAGHKSVAGGGPCHMPSRAAIKARITRLRREADNLEALLRSIPENLPAEADEALWGLVTKN